MINFNLLFYLISYHLMLLPTPLLFLFFYLFLVPYGPWENLVQSLHFLVSGTTHDNILFLCYISYSKNLKLDKNSCSRCGILYLFNDTYSTVQYSTVQYSTVQYSTVLKIPIKFLVLISLNFYMSHR